MRPSTRALCLCVALMATILYPFLALAQDLPASPVAVGATSFDIGSLLSWLESFVIPALAALIIVLAHRAVSAFDKLVGIQSSDAMTALLDTAISDGIALAKHTLDGKLQGLAPIDVRSQIAAQALGFVQASAKDALDHFGITPDALAAKITAALSADLPLPVTTLPAVTATPPAAPSAAAAP